MDEESVLCVTKKRSSVLDAAARLQEFLAFVREEDAEAHGILLAPLLDHIGKMVHINDNIGEARSLQFLELVFEQRLSTYRHQSLWHSVRQRLEPCAQSCCEYHRSARRQHLFYALFAMADVNLNAKLLVYMFRQMLGAVNAAMLASSTAEAEHQIRESTL